MLAKESRRLLLSLTALGLVASLASIDATALTASLVSAAKEYQQEHQTLLALLAVPTMALWVVGFVPSTPLELALGFIFGVRTGYIVVLTGKTLGCGVSFLLARTVAFYWAQRTFGQHRFLHAIDDAVRQAPWRTCLALRIALIPIALKNYGLALLSVRARHFFGSLIGWELLNSVVLVYAGAIAGDLGSLLRGDSPKSAGQVVAMAVGCGVTVLVMVSASRFASAALREAEASAGTRPNGHLAQVRSSRAPASQKQASPERRRAQTPPRGSPLAASNSIGGLPGRAAADRLSQRPGQRTQRSPTRSRSRR